MNDQVGLCLGDQGICPVAPTAPSQLVAEVKLPEELSGSIMGLQGCLHCAESDLQRSQEEVTICHHDLVCESKVRETLERMLDFRTEELEEL